MRIYNDFILECRKIMEIHGFVEIYRSHPLSPTMQVDFIKDTIRVQFFRQSSSIPEYNYYMLYMDLYLSSGVISIKSQMYKPNDGKIFIHHKEFIKLKNKIKNPFRLKNLFKFKNICN